ncbi:Pectinesterase inhibitor, putative [Ricinus communis]|uniref:Pectinesterase inhibitor, putative n=1 Tax=Ricinus communis TaxID=3988 RepID=B9SKH2_RICCO|nr:Pectinesterase inhibitor, putative [Ricinus communis]|eukprot:XP_002526502.1 putative invertase inhibitor [Ricinus communis]
MKPNLSYLFLLLLFTFHAIIATNLIQETCNKCAINDPNISYDFCLTSLRASPGSHCASLSELGMISINLTRHNVTDTRRYIKGLLKNKRLDPDARACLNDCLHLYSDAIPSLKQAVKDYKSKHYEDANIQVSSVIDASTTCADGFNEKGVASPLKARNNDTFQLSAISLSIINMLH